MGLKQDIKKLFCLIKIIDETIKQEGTTTCFLSNAWYPVLIANRQSGGDMAEHDWMLWYGEMEKDHGLTMWILLCMNMCERICFTAGFFFL